MPFIVERKGDAVWVRYEKARSGFEAWVLVRGDAHFDSAGADCALEIAHLEQAKERNAAIIDIGDLFDAMQSKHDPRAKKDEGLDEYEVVNYLDELVQGATDRYAPYAPNFAVLLRGNHEQKVLEHQNSDLTRRLAAGLRGCGSQVEAAGVEQWVRFHFTGGSFDEPANRSTSIDAYLLHGYGGGAPVTKGTIQMERRQAWISADLIISGHIHVPLNLPMKRVRLDQAGNQECRRVDHVQVSGYKTGRGSFEEKKGLRPQIQTAYWIHFYHHSGTLKRRVLEVSDL